MPLPSQCWCPILLSHVSFPGWTSLPGLFGSSFWLYPPEKCLLWNRWCPIFLLAQGILDRRRHGFIMCLLIFTHLSIVRCLLKLIKKSAGLQWFHWPKARNGRADVILLVLWRQRTPCKHSTPDRCFPGDDEFNKQGFFQPLLACSC